MISNINKTYGKLILEDPTNSGVGDKILELITNKPLHWKRDVEELYKQYNELVGFEAFGHNEDVFEVSGSFLVTSTEIKNDNINTENITYGAREEESDPEI